MSHVREFKAIPTGMRAWFFPLLPWRRWRYNWGIAILFVKDCSK